MTNRLPHKFAAPTGRQWQDEGEKGQGSMRAWLCQKFGAYFDQQMSMFDSISSCLSIDDIACVVYLDEALEGLLAGVGGVDAVARLIRRAPRLAAADATDRRVHRGLHRRSTRQ